jgi:hypothetical protein
MEPGVSFSQIPFMTRSQVVESRRALRKQNARYHRHLTEVPKEEWESLKTNPMPVKVWQSKEFLVQQFSVSTVGGVRLSVNRTAINDDGSWVDGITWDDLQRIKHECGFGNEVAIEIFPPDKDVVNVANLRHLWIVHPAPEFMWRGKGS